MKSFRLGTMVGALFAGLIVTSSFAAAEDDVSQIKQQLEELEEKMRSLRRLHELDKEAATAKSKEAASVSASKDGFYLKSGDGAFSLRLGAVVQADSRWYSDHSPPSGPPSTSASDTFLLRKARPIFEALFAEKFALKIMPDFGNGQTLQEAYVEARFAPAFNVRAGKFKSPVGLERLQLDSENEFIERALPTNLAPNRDVGLQFAGSVLSNTMSYQLGIFNGIYDNGLSDGDTNNGKDGVGRIFLEPFRNVASAFKGLGFGISYSTGSHLGSPTASDLPQFKTMGQQNFFTYANGAYADGTQDRVSPQFYYYIGPVGLLGEYISSRQKISRGTNLRQDIDNRAWQIAGYWVITGENASYRGVHVPNRPYAPSDGRWGAFEMVTRYSVQTNDDDAFVGSSATWLANPAQSAREAREVGVGLNWYLNRNIKVQINYEETHFDGGATFGDRATEKVILTRFQAAI